MRFYESLVLFVWLMDYDNQFYISSGGKLELVMSDKVFTDPMSIMSYITSTKYALSSENARDDVIRRLNNILYDTAKESGKHISVSLG